MSPSDPRLELIQRYLDGVASEEETRRLEVELRSDIEFRHYFVEYSNVDNTIGTLGAQGELPGLYTPLVKAPSKNFLQNLVSTAAKIAAGVGIGFLSANAARAYSLPQGFERGSTPLPLVNGDFEDMPSPGTKGIPSRADEWSGDVTARVESGDNVKPREGRYMMRFLLPYNSETSPQESRRASEIWQLVDIRNLRPESKQDVVNVELSAWFCASNQVQGSKDLFGLAILAFQGRPEDAREIWNNRREEALVSSEKNEAISSQWTRLSTQLTVPPQAEFLLLQVRVLARDPLKPEVPFAGHFVDGVELRRLEKSAAPMN